MSNPGSRLLCSYVRDPNPEPFPTGPGGAAATVSFLALTFANLTDKNGPFCAGLQLAESSVLKQQLLSGEKI